MSDYVVGELIYYAHILDPCLPMLEIIPISDAHYGNPLFSKKHFLRTIDYIKEQPHRKAILNGDLCESTLKTSKGDIYRQVGTPQDQRDWIAEQLKPIKDSILGMTCLTDDTLVLTNEGWKTCGNITTNDKALSLNLDNNQLEYSEIKGVYIKPWDGNIIHLSSDRQSQMLTPDHRVLYWNDFKNKYEYRLAESLPNDMHHITIPLAREYHNGDTRLTDDQVRFFAWMITEGHIDNKRSSQTVFEISQSLKSEYIDELESLFNRLNLSPNKHFHKGRNNRTKENDWVCYYFPHKQIVDYAPILSNKKEIPRYLLELPYHQLKILFETLMKGDGSKGTYYTSNPNLAKQVMELVIKMGFGCSLHTRNRLNKYNGYNKWAYTTSYEMHKYNCNNMTPHIKTTLKYKGKVFCLSTGLGNFVAMRDGKPFITGNSGNHENRINNEAGIDICKDIAKELSIPYRNEGMLLKVSFGDRNNRVEGRPYTYWVYMTHGYGGARTNAAKTVKVERTSTFIHADCYVMCLSEDTEILTIDGWKTHLSLEEGETVLTLNQNSGKFEWQPIRSIHRYDRFKELVNLHSKKGIDICATPEHRVIYRYDGVYLEKPLGEFAHLQSQVDIPRCGEMSNYQGLDFSDDELRLFAWVITEGHFRKDSAAIDIRQTNNSLYYGEIKGLLDRLGIEYSLYCSKVKGKPFFDSNQNKTYYYNSDVSTFHIKPGAGRCIRKILFGKQIPPYFNRMTLEQYEVFMGELFKGDGYKTIQYTTKDPILAGQIQILAFTHNHRATIYKNSSNGKTKFTVSFTKRVGKGIIPSRHVDKISYDGVVWCASVGNGNFTVRRNGKAYIIGNSHDHVSNAAPVVYLMPDNRTSEDKETGFRTGAIKAVRKLLVKSNAYVKWGGYAEIGGFPPSDLTTPIIYMYGTDKPMMRALI